jgi:hypothetical protein
MSTVPDTPTLQSPQQTGAGVALITISPAATGDPATSYTIFYKESTSPTWDLSLSTVATTVDISSLSPSVEYSFAATADNAIGPSTLSNTVTITLDPPTLPPTITSATPADGAVEIAWTDVSFATSYTVYYKLTSAPEYDLSAAVVGTTSTTITGLTNRQEYTFAVAGQGAAGQGTLSATATATPIAPAPANFSAFSNFLQVDLSWSPVPSATSYTVYRSPGGSYIITAPTTTATITDISAGPAYTFTVSATVGGIETAISEPVEASMSLPEYATAYDITTDGTYIYTAGRALGSLSYSGSPATTVDIDAKPYIAATSLADGSVAWLRDYSGTYVSNVLITTPQLLAGIDLSAQIINTFDISSGAPGWSLSAPEPTELFYDPQGHIHIVGRFTGVYNPGGSAPAISSATNDVYLLTVDMSGTPIGARNLTSTLHGPGSTLQLRPTCVTVGGENHMTYVGGTFSGVGTDLSASETYNAGFVMSVDDSGNIFWLRSIDADFLDDLFDIEFRDGLIYICGSYHQRSRYLAFDEIIALPTSPDDSGEGYVAALDTSGTYLWVQKIGCDVSGASITEDQSLIRGITIDPSGTIYFAGDFIDNPVILDVSGAPVQIPYTNTGRNGFFGAMNMVPVPPSAPLPPVDVSAVSLALNEITVSWTPNPSGGPARSFKVFFKSEFDATFTQFVNTYDLSYTFTDLASAYNYNFAVESVGPGGISFASDVVTARPLSSAPAPPPDISANPANGAIKLTWGSSFDTFYYNIYVRPTGSPTWDISYLEIYDFQYTVSGLTNGQQYDVAISASNQEGEGARSTPVTVTPNPQPPSIPARIQVTTSDQLITLTWPADPDATSYDVYYRPSSSSDPYDVSSVTVATFTDTFPNGVEYTFYLTATGSQGTSAASDTVTATAAVPVPAQPSFTVIAGDYSATVLIIDVSFAITYNIYQAVSGSIVYVPSNPATVSAPASDVPVTIIDLSNNVTYDIKVTATGVNGTSVDYVYQQVTPFAPQPDTPTLNDPYKSSETSVDLSWSAVSPGNTTEYRVYYADTSAVVLEPATSTTIGGLTTGETYTFFVTAFGRGGESFPSFSKTIAVNAYPAPPADLSATVVGNDIVVTWSDVSGATQYTFYNRTPGAEWIAADVDATVTSVSVPATYNVTYEFSVSVLTADGPSELATPIQIMIPFPLPGAPSIQAAAGDGVLDISWSEVIYSLSYVVNAVPTGSGPGFVAGVTQDISWATTDTSAIISAENGVEYSVTVVAVGVEGAGPASTAVVVIPLPPLCVAPAAPQVAAGDTVVTVSWLPVARADSYVLFWGADSSLNVVGGGPVLSADISGLVNDTTYDFQVAGANYAGIGALSVATSVTPRNLPAAPTGLAAAAGDGYVDLSWNSATFATKYTIYRAIDGSEEYELLGDVVEPFVFVNMLTNGVMYKFKVAGVNVDLEGALAGPVESIPFATGAGSVNVVEPPLETKAAVLNVLGPNGATNETDQALFNDYLDNIIGNNTSEIIVDEASNRTIGAFAAADIGKRKELAPEEPLMTDSRANIFDLEVPADTSAVIVNMLPVGTDTVNLGSPERDVVVDVQRYDAQKALIPSVNLDTTTYTRIVFERDVSAVNVYRLIGDEPFLMITLDTMDVVGKTGAFDCSGMYMGLSANGLYRFSYFGPFSYTIITGLTPTAAVACLVSGTGVKCPGGVTRLVDDLLPGDRLLCDDGRAVAVKAVYVTDVAAASETNAPVVVPRGFGGLGADVVVSDCHAVKCRDGWLIPRVAEKRAGRRLFERRGVGEAVRYFHIEMPNYLSDNLVLDDGVVVESFGRGWAATQPESVLRGLWRLNRAGLLDRAAAAGAGAAKATAKK